MISRPGRLLASIGFLLLCSCSDTGSPEKAAAPDAAMPVSAAPEYLGSEACAGCHDEQFRQWQTSHHYLAMDEAASPTMIGDFSGHRVEYFDEVAEIETRDGKYYVRAPNSSGEPEDFEVVYTFGVEPLQQYLVRFPDGRLQALAYAWDSRPAEQGGQRWFHLYPDEFIDHADPLHWTRSEQNWNYMCAECHSTDLKKNYDLATDSFATSWEEIRVGCEACHGPASRHVAMADAGNLGGDMGLEVSLDDAGRAVWEMDPFSGIASRSEVRMQPPIQPEACGRCHSRRALVSPDYEYGLSLLDTHRPSLLDLPLYHPDGQILEEVYVYGSFLQSKMYRAGVSCTDCHNPHSAELRSGDNLDGVCATCHLPTKFDTAEHHHHEPGQARCVDCHMREETYMVVDPRRDHSFRVPRPDLSAAIGVPNACNDCHDDRDAAWAADAAREWYGVPDDNHFAHAFHAASNGEAGSNDALLRVINDSSNAGIVRATAFTLYRPPLTREHAESIRRGLQDPDPLVRIGALQGLVLLPPEAAIQWAVSLLEDPRLAVRLEAYSLIAPVQQALQPPMQAAFARARSEFIESQMAIAERPEAHINLGNTHAAAGDFESAEASYRLALQREPRAAGARINLADLYRQMRRDGDAENLLLEGIDIDAENAPLRHSLGLALVRMQRNDEALEQLAKAAELAPDAPRYTYVYAIALNSTGQPEKALETITKAVEDFPGDFEIGFTHVSLLRDAGLMEQARDAAAKLVQRFPGDENALQLLRSFDAA